MAADSGGKDRDLKKRMKSDPYFIYAIKECYASFKNIIYALVIGPRERDVIQKIFKVVDDHVAEDTLIKELNMSNLPTLSKKFVELLDLLLKNNKEDQGQIIILFQDMLEVVMRDIMDEQLIGLLESVHGGNYRRHEGITPLDQQDQLFTKAIDFPVKESQAWIEKVLFYSLFILKIAIYFLIKLTPNFVIKLISDKKTSPAANCEGIGYGCSYKSGC
jgi:callose synthase